MSSGSHRNVSGSISQKILELCDEVVTIEMQEGIKSLNVSVAASIIMYSFKQNLLKTH